MDLDFFSPTEDIPTLRPALEKTLASFSPILSDSAWGNLVYLARKDFYDLYFICQEIPLRTLLAMAPRKYPSVRDFETQTVKRLAYFENAETDPDPKLLSPVSWQQVKEYFVRTSKQIAGDWLA